MSPIPTLNDIKKALLTGDASNIETIVNDIRTRKKFSDCARCKGHYEAMQFLTQQGEFDPALKVLLNFEKIEEKYSDLIQLKARITDGASNSDDESTDIDPLGEIKSIITLPFTVAEEILGELFGKPK